MKRLTGYANAYIRQSDWKDVALLKVCVASLGMLIGMWIPARKRRGMTVGAAVVFLLTYLPLMSSFLRTVAALARENRQGSRDR